MFNNTQNFHMKTVRFNNQQDMDKWTMNFIHNNFNNDNTADSSNVRYNVQVSTFDIPVGSLPQNISGLPKRELVKNEANASFFKMNTQLQPFQFVVTITWEY